MAVTVIQVGTGAANKPSDGQTGVSQYPTSIGHYILLETPDFGTSNVSSSLSTITWGGSVHTGASVFSTKQKIIGYDDRYLYEISTYLVDPILVSSPGATYSWSMQLKDSGGSLLWESPTYSYTVAGGVPSKASNPSPSNENENDGCFDYRLSWSGDGDDYDVLIGSESGSLSQIASGTTDNPYTVSEEDFPTNTIVYWRIDSNNDTGTTVGDEWWFDPRPGVSDNPTPEDGYTNISTTQSRLYWDGGKLYQTFDVYINNALVLEDTTNEHYDLDDYAGWPLLPYATYSWYVVTKNAHGSTESDTWEFTTGKRFSLVPPRQTSYGEDLAWDVDNGEWAGISDLVVAGGGSMQSQIVLVGHKVIYFGSI